MAEQKKLLRALAGETQDVPPIWMMRQAAFWAAEHGATEMAVLCTKENTGANRLYASLGMTCCGQYHLSLIHI